MMEEWNNGSKDAMFASPVIHSCYTRWYYFARNPV